MGGESLSKGGCKYAAAVLAPNRRIYGLPCSARRVLEVHPEAGYAREIGPDLGPGFKFQAAAASAARYGGRVYGIPFDAPRVLEIDPATSAVHEIGPELPGKGDRYTAGVFDATGRVLYALPNNNPRLLHVELKSERHDDGKDALIVADVRQVG